MRVFSYYHPDPAKDPAIEHRRMTLFINEWKRLGPEPIILTYAHALRHPQFDPALDPQVHRWFALAVASPSKCCLVDYNVRPNPSLKPHVPERRAIAVLPDGLGAVGIPQKLLEAVLGGLWPTESITWDDGHPFCLNVAHPHVQQADFWDYTGANEVTAVQWPVDSPAREAAFR